MGVEARRTRLTLISRLDLALLKGPDLAVTPLQVAEPKENQRGSILV